MGAKTDALCSFGGWLLKVAADAAEPTETQRSARKVAEYKAKTEVSVPCEIQRVLFTMSFGRLEVPKSGVC